MFQLLVAKKYFKRLLTASPKEVGGSGLIHGHTGGRRIPLRIVVCHV